VEQTSLFTQVGEVAVPFSQPLTEDQFVDRVGSISFVAALDPGPRTEVLERVRRVAGTTPEPLSYTSEMLVYERLPGGASA
jgi:hypothetical protein